jgi:hypothetical protein
MTTKSIGKIFSGDCRRPITGSAFSNEWKHISDCDPGRRVISFEHRGLGPNFQPEYSKEEMERMERMKDILNPAIGGRGFFLRPSGAIAPLDKSKRRSINGK